MGQHDQTARDRETYITLDTYSAAKGDAAGFGFGSVGAFGGGYGIGGNGPQPAGETQSQAHYREEAKPGVDVAGGTDVISAREIEDEHRDYPRWLEGFPHSFHGWGPNAPDYDAHVEHENRSAAHPDVRRGQAHLALTSGAQPFATGFVWNRPA